MFLSHMDNKAQKKIIGHENEYVKAMERLDRYYGDTHKVVQACTVEIKSHQKFTRSNTRG